MKIIIPKKRNKSRGIFFLVSLFLVFLGLFFWFKLNNKFKAEIIDLDKTKVLGAGEALKLEAVEKLRAANGDIEPQKPLANPSEKIKAIYVTSWSASSEEKIDSFIELIKKAELNAMVIDIKDYSGYVTYDTEAEDVIKYKTKEVRISQINSLIKKMHDENIYAIARVAVFQDMALAAANPDLAVKNKVTGKLWKDNKGLAWIDPASRQYWDYIIEISRDASHRGFDEINFDYIRFPSDGDLSQMSFPFYKPKAASKEDVIKEFFVYLRSNLKSIKISADLFGLATAAKDDLGIGQVIEDAYQNFDYVSPMIYPSHYAAGFLGYKNPAQYPYEVVKYSMESAAKRLAGLNKERENDSESKTVHTAKIRPWLQAFDMGAEYDNAKIKLQIKANDEAGGTGWMLWNPSNNYSSLLF